MRPLPSLNHCVRSFAAGWNTFFFNPVDLRICAAVRIAFALLLLVNFALLGPDLFRWFGAQGVTRDMPLDEYLAPGSWSVLTWLPPTNMALAAAYGVVLLQGALLLVGLGTRLQAIGCFVWLVSFQNRNPMLWDGEDTVFRLIAALLVLMPCGAAWSLDRLLLGRFAPAAARPREGVAWALKLLQLQMTIIFFATFAMKLQGAAWQDGVALFYVARLDEFFPRFPVPMAIFDQLWAVRLMTWGTLAIELAVPLLVWFRETRRTALVLAMLFHLVCDYSMNLFLFHWIMLTGWLAFVRPEDWQSLHALLAGRKMAGVGAGISEAPAGVQSPESSLAAFAKPR